MSGLFCLKSETIQVYNLEDSYSEDNIAIDLIWKRFLNIINISWNQIFIEHKELQLINDIQRIPE